MKQSIGVVEICIRNVTLLFVEVSGLKKCYNSIIGQVVVDLPALPTTTPSFRLSSGEKVAPP
jgi:hypothetical protein